MKLAKIIVVHIRGEECMGHVFADLFDVLDNRLLGVKEVKGDELDSGINLVDLERFARGDDDL